MSLLLAWLSCTSGPPVSTRFGTARRAEAPACPCTRTRCERRFPEKQWSPLASIVTGSLMAQAGQAVIIGALLCTSDFLASKALHRTWYHAEHFSVSRFQPWMWIILTHTLRPPCSPPPCNPPFQARDFSLLSWWENASLYMGMPDLADRAITALTLPVTTTVAEGSFRVMKGLLTADRRGMSHDTQIGYLWAMVNGVVNHRIPQWALV